jgi:hypothetical protein
METDASSIKVFALCYDNLRRPPFWGEVRERVGKATAPAVSNNIAVEIKKLSRRLRDLSSSLNVNAPEDIKMAIRNLQQRHE